VLRHFLGQPWVLVATLLIGSTILYLIYRRRSRATEDAKQPAAGTPRPAGTPKAAPVVAAPSQTEDRGVRKALGSGFRGIKWGQPPVEGMAAVHEEGETRFLVRPSDDLKIGNVHISSAAYSFRLNRLETVVIELQATGFELLIRHLTSEWGPPRSTPDRGKHVWADPGTGPEASQAILEKKADSRTARLVISSKAANAERAAARPVA
jgi:hypothetical protein